MEPHSERPLVTWSVPRRPYTVEFAPRTLDDIRLAVVDAFFSLPRGGTEIGGILLGCFRDGRLRILDSRPLECEHAMGPSFTLSARDHARLAKLLADAASGAPERQPVGWYHSHTRSDIFLTEADREIHLRYFPEPWQTALVLRPHAMQPARAGFFFREADGSMRGESSDSEIVLEALPVQPAPRAEPAVAGGRVPRPPADMPSGPPAITLPPQAVISIPERQPEPPAAVVPAAPAEPPSRPEPTDERPDGQPVPIPKFLETPPGSGSRHAVLTLAILGGCLAAAAAAFETRTLWLPRVAALYRRSEPASPPLFLGLNAIDLAGQLQVRWDRNSPAVREADEGMIEILDGATPHATALDAAHLQAGVFTYARQTERVDVTLSARLPDGRMVREATSFLGRSPDGEPAAENPDVRKAREDFARQTAKLKSDLRAQTARTRTLEKSVEEVQKQLRDQQARRMLNQDAGR
jgi:proteasome lid subunit RPN8/RPN11